VFLREHSNEVDRVVHMSQLRFVAPAVKPLNALVLVDELGECCVMTIGSDHNDAAALRSSRDQWFTVLGRLLPDSLQPPVSPGSGCSVKRPMFEAIVKKKGRSYSSLGKWKIRRFVIDNEGDESTGELKGDIPMHTIEHVTPGNGPHFNITSRPVGVKEIRVWDLQAASENQMQQWVTLLDQCMVSLRKNRSPPSSFNMAPPGVKGTRV